MSGTSCSGTPFHAAANARLSLGPGVQVQPRRSTNIWHSHGRAATILVVTDPSAADVLRAMVIMFASGDPSGASAVVADDYLDHQGLGQGPLRGIDRFASGGVGQAVV